MRGAGVVAVLTLGLALAGCTSRNFQCSDDSACVLDGQTGACEEDGFCSFPDPGCDSGRRYGEFGENPYAGQCVSDDAATSGTSVASTTTGSTGPQTTLPPPSGTSASSSTTTVDPTLGTSSGSSDGSTSLGGSSSGSSSESGNVDPIYNIAFLASTPVLPGAMGGIAGADEICATAARRGGFAGTFVAVMSDADTLAVDRLEGARGWVRPDGLAIADRPIDLLQGRMWHPVNLDETGQALLDALIITGSSGDGTLDDASTCDNWTSIAPDLTFRRGRSGRTYDDWLSSGTSFCDSNAHVQCFGVDQNEALEFEVEEGRLAFVSQAPVSADAGRDAFDAVCAAEASAAKLSGSFLAFVGTSTVAPLERFDTSGPQWVNTNGFPIADSAAALSINTHLIAPVGFTVDGQPSLSNVWTGADSAVDTDTFTCDDWSSAVGGAWAGVAGNTESWVHVNYVGCSAELPVYCFEE